MEVPNDHGDGRMDRRTGTAVGAVLGQLIEHGAGGIASVFARVFALAMRIARERWTGAGRDARTPGRQGHAAGGEPGRIDTAAGTLVRAGTQNCRA
jgi:hypothetical protein